MNAEKISPTAVGQSFALRCFRIKENALVAVSFLVLFWIFTRSAGQAFSIWYSFLAVMFFPGLLFAKWALPDWSAWEQALFGSFVGFGAGPIIIYYLSYIGLHSIQPMYIIGVAVFSIAGIILLDRKPKSA